MEKEYRIWLLLIAVMLLSSAVGKAEGVLLRDAPKIQQAQDERPSRTLPAQRAYLSIYQTAESAVHILERSPHSNAGERTWPFSHRRAAAEREADCFARERLRIFPAVHHSQTLKKTIYPFHSHW